MTDAFAANELLYAEVVRLRSDLEAARKEVEQQQEDNRWLREYQQRIVPQVEEWKAEVERLRAAYRFKSTEADQQRSEVERLRAALERIAQEGEFANGAYIARQALQPTKEGV